MKVSRSVQRQSYRPPEGPVAANGNPPDGRVATAARRRIEARRTDGMPVPVP